MQQPHSPLAASCFSSCLLPSIFEGGFRLPAIAVHPVFQGVPTLPSLMGDTSGLSLSLACDLLIFCFTPILFLCFPLSAISSRAGRMRGCMVAAVLFAIPTVGVRLIMANLRFQNIIALPGVAAPPGSTS